MAERGKYDGERIRFGTDANGRPLVYTPSELLAKATLGADLHDLVDALNEAHFGTPDVGGFGFTAGEDLGDEWKRVVLDGGPPEGFDPVDAIGRLTRRGIDRDAGFLVQPNHIYFMDSLGGSSSFAPNQFAPNQFAPNQFAPNQFAPNQFAPNQFAPNQFAPNQFAQLMGGAAAGCCECPQAPGFEDEPPFVPELTARRAYGPPPSVRELAPDTAEVQIHVMDVRRVIEPGVGQAAVRDAQNVYDKQMARTPEERNLLDNLEETPGAILQWAVDVKTKAGQPASDEKRSAFDKFAEEPSSPGRGSNGNSDSYVDPVCGHMEFIEGIVGRIVDGNMIRSHAIAGTLGDITDTELRTALEIVHDRHESEDAADRRILSLSLSGYNIDDRPGSFVADQIAKMQREGWLIVASAGNNASCRLAWPAALPGVVAVSAYGQAGPAWFSNYGPWVDACAPGVNIISDYPDLTGADLVDAAGDPLRVGDSTAAREFDTGYASWSGTSFSAPFVAAQLAAWMIKNAAGVEKKEAYRLALDEVIREPSLARWPNYGTVVEFRREING